jgi:hypothetical protein
MNLLIKLKFSLNNLLLLDGFLAEPRLGVPGDNLLDIVEGLFELAVRYLDFSNDANVCL